MLLHSQHQRIAFIFEHLAWSTQKRCCVTSQLCAREDHPKLLKDPSGGKKVREIPLLTTSLKTFDLRHQQQPKRASHPVCWEGEGASHWSAGGQVRTDTPAFTMHFNNNVQGTVFWWSVNGAGWVGGWVGGWTSQWMTKPGLYHKAQIIHELQVRHVNPQEWTGRRVNVPLFLSIALFVVDQQKQPMMAYNHRTVFPCTYCNPSALIRWSSLTLLHTWIWDEWSSNSTALTNSKFHTKSLFIASHVQFLHYSPSHCTHTGLE